MLPIRWDPFKDLSTLHKEMDDLFRRTFGSFGLTREPAVEAEGWVTPSVNTFVKGNIFHIQAEIPGVSKDDLDVHVDGNILTLKGERTSDKETKEKDFYLRESQYGSFMRRLTLPEGVNTEKIHASYRDGILEITMPMAKKLPTGRKVLIEGHGEGKKGKEVH